MNNKKGRWLLLDDGHDTALDSSLLILYCQRFRLRKGASMRKLEWNPVPVAGADSVWIDDLEIIFHRTVRAPDNNQTSALPPSLGRFPLLQVKDYVQNLPATMASKGGLFLPMYR